MRKSHVAAYLIAIAVLAGCNGKETPTTSTVATTDTTPTSPPVTAAAPIRLDQGWTAEEAEQFYYTPQGSQLIPYAWFLALEVDGGESLFRDNAHMERLGYITASAASPGNPDALPVGFVVDSGTEPMLTPADDIGSADPQRSTGPSGNTGAGSTKWLGMTCAACHTGELRHGGKTFRIDGGPAMADHETFTAAMARALEATHRDDAKFTRFAQRVLGTSYNAEAANKLKADLTAYTASFKQAVERNAAPVVYGFARLDAFGAIFNQVTEVALAIPGNHAPSDAPVSFPFLWGTPALDWVQWNGSVDNPLARNVGEVMGVYGNFTLDPVPPEKQFTSSVRLLNLDKMEQQIARLSAPKWPEEHFGAIDQAKADAGKQLYAETCIKCHFVRDANGAFPMTPPNKFGKQFVRTVMVPVATIGTDPMMVKRFTRMVDPGVLKPLVGNAAQAPAATVLGVADRGVILRAFAALQPPLTDAQKLAMMGFRDPDSKPPNPLGYKARPLDGIWATAPFLHAGSVPNLYQLLLPAKDRVKNFHVGSRDFDPADVGFSTQPSPGSFEFRTNAPDGTPIAGNSNAGHEGLYYTQIRQNDANRDFTDTERRAIIEYLKTLR
ncbi:MAG TPA: di-heme-cytochrome C peroxidase [Thermoanaerobaculia bacterium]